MNKNLFAKIVLASMPTNGALPLITMHCRYPRIIHAEVMTHRVFSRNARSSRAVPVRKMLEEVRNDPFVPWHWGKNQAGMQAGEECNELIKWKDASVCYPDGSVVEDAITREEGWLKARDFAADMAEAYMNAGYHKQLPNRLLEPFMWIDTLITSTQWSNFLWLRDHGAAEPHLRDLAKLVGEALDDAVYDELHPGEWHLPYITEDEGFGEELSLDTLKKISAARCARISYAPFDGNPTIERELERYSELISGDRVHASPVEHQASPDVFETHGGVGYAAGWQFEHLAGNLGPGWIQYRKTIPGEAAVD